MSEPNPVVARFFGFVLDEANARLTRDGTVLELPPKAFEVLCALARRPAQLVTKNQLLDAVWGHRHVSESVLKSTISQLRQVLADDARAPRLIETAARRGYRFIAVLDAAEAAPAMPAVARDAVPPAPPAPSTLIGREAALAALAAHRDDAFGYQRRQFVLVAGEAGIGKTALLDGFVAGIDAGVLIARGQCVEHYGAGEPYMPVLEALNALCRNPVHGRELIDRMRSVAPSWLAQLPWYLDDADRARLQREVAGATAERMLREFGELVDRIAAVRPLLLLLEDLHWSDHATVQLIGFLARRRGPAALLVLGSLRPADAIAAEHPLAGLRHELRAHRLCTELDLDCFSEAELGALVARRLATAAVPEDFVRSLHAHTEGLPLFAINLMDELLDAGRLAPDGDRWRFPRSDDFGVPDSIAGVIERQIERLDPTAQRRLAVASVLGAEFDGALLAAVLETPEPELTDELDAAARRGTWLVAASGAGRAVGRSGARYAFRHALYRHVFYQRLAPAARRATHARAAAVFGALPLPQQMERAGEIGLHAERAGDTAGAARWLALAAARALGRGAPEEALVASRRGLALLGPEPPPELALDLTVLEGVALTRQQVFTTPEVADAFERARLLCDRVVDSPARARAMQGLWWVSFARGDLAVARGLARRIHALGVGAGSSDVALGLAGHNALGMTLSMAGEFSAARSELEAAIALFREHGQHLPPGLAVNDPGVEAHGYFAMTSWWSGHPVAARRALAEAIALAESIRHSLSEVIANHLAALLHLFAGEYDRGLERIGRVFALIDQHHLPKTPGVFGWVRGSLLAKSGRTDEGLALIEAGDRSSREIGMRVARSGQCLHLSEALRIAGRIDASYAVVQDGLAAVEQSGERMVWSPLLRGAAECEAARGDRAAAAASLRKSLEVACAQDGGWFLLLGLAAARRLDLVDITPWHAWIDVFRERYADDPSPLAATALSTLLE